MRWQLTNSGVHLTEVPLAAPVTSQFGSGVRNPPPGFVAKKPPPGLGTDEETAPPPGFSAKATERAASHMPSVRSQVTAATSAANNTTNVTTPPGLDTKVIPPPGFGSRSKSLPPGFEPDTTTSLSPGKPKPFPVNEPTSPVSRTPDLSLTEEQKNWRKRSLNPLVAPPGSLAVPLPGTSDGDIVQEIIQLYPQNMPTFYIPENKPKSPVKAPHVSTLFIPNNQPNPASPVKSLKTSTLFIPPNNQRNATRNFNAELDYSIRKADVAVAAIDQAVPPQLQKFHEALKQMTPAPKTQDADHIDLANHDHDDYDDDSSTPTKVSVATWRAVSVSHSMLCSSSKMHFSFGVANMCELLQKYGKEMDQFNKSEYKYRVVKKKVYPFCIIFLTLLKLTFNRYFGISLNW